MNDKSKIKKKIPSKEFTVRGKDGKDYKVKLEKNDDARWDKYDEEIDIKAEVTVDGSTSNENIKAKLVKSGWRDKIEIKNVKGQDLKDTKIIKVGHFKYWFWIMIGVIILSFVGLLAFILTRRKKDTEEEEL